MTPEIEKAFLSWMETIQPRIEATVVQLKAHVERLRATGMSDTDALLYLIASNSVAIELSASTAEDLDEILGTDVETTGAPHT